MIDNFEDIRVIESFSAPLFHLFPLRESWVDSFCDSPRVPTSATTAEHPSDTEAS